MKKIIKSKLLIGAFLISYFSFFLATMNVQRNGFGIGHLEYGLPFSYYYSHCFGGYYIWSGLIGNILFAMIFSFIVGIFSVFLWRNFFVPFLKKVSSPEFRRKWHI